MDKDKIQANKKAFERRFYGMGIEEFRQIVKTELWREQLFSIMRLNPWESELLTVLRDLGFKMPANRKPRGKPKRDVGQCVFAAWLRRQGIKVKDIADVLDVARSRDAYGNESWSYSAKRYIDDGERYLTALRLGGIDVKMYKGDLGLFFRGKPFNLAALKRGMNDVKFQELRTLLHSLIKNYRNYLKSEREE